MKTKGEEKAKLSKKISEWLALPETKQKLEESEKRCNEMVTELQKAGKVDTEMLNTPVTI